MKNFVFTFWIVLSYFIVCPSEAFSQYFLAGQHSVSDYYVNIDPDSTVIGPNNHGGNPLPAAIYQIDINGDSVNDFHLYSYGFWMNGGGDSELSIRSNEINNCQIAFGYYDTCHQPNSNYSLFSMAKSLKKNDTINDKLDWNQGGRFFLTYTDWIWMAYNCGGNSFVNSTEDNYIAVRLFQPNDTLYGWIKVTNVNALIVTVQEFACNKKNTGIDEHNDLVRIYPIPTNNYITIETQMPDFHLIIYNQYGMETLNKNLVKGNNLIELSSYANGAYIFKLLRNNSIIIKKVIKQ
ncbi:MAG: T9SS type A sorting domain-containing protein [Bacteroidales bacterium]|nr:T9SS type A sorting domain-containing protein [Bacteroidales bacterium]